MLVGADAGYPPEFASLFERSKGSNPRREEEVALIARMGVPPAVARYCRFWPANPSLTNVRPVAGAVVVLHVGGNDGPARSVAELAQLKELNIGFDLSLQPNFDLSELADVIDFAPHLTIRGASVHGWEALRAAAKMRSCNLIADPPDPINLDTLENLEYAFINSANAAYVASNPNLKELRATLEDWPPGLIVGRSLRRLEIWESKRLRRLPPMRDSSSLIELDIRYTLLFDLESIRPTRNLRKLSLGSCKKVLNCDALLDLPHLEDVMIGDVAQMPGWQSLEGLRVSHFDLPAQRFADPEKIRELSEIVMSPHL